MCCNADYTPGIEPKQDHMVGGSGISKELRVPSVPPELHSPSLSLSLWLHYKETFLYGQQK